MKMRIENPAAARAVGTVCERVKKAGGRALLVGGSVRDAVLGLPAKDLDIEVFRLDPARLERLLADEFRVDAVGRAFGVLKIHGLPIDVSVPRRERKSGHGHRGFEVAADPFMSYAEAAARRDFTMNALAHDPLTGEILDPHGGLADLDRRVLRHTSERFVEDPLRVLRGMQFAGRFDLLTAPQTLDLCRRLTPEGLARERIFEEWRKLIVMGIRPSRGLEFLRDSGWVAWFPELEALIGCRQEEDWHPEGDVWIHTLHCMDAYARERTIDPWEELVVGLAVLCHDLGKPATTTVEGGRVRSRGHDVAGAAPTRTFLARLACQDDLIEQVVPLVVHHLHPADLYKSGSKDVAVRRLARRVGRIDRLVRVARADRWGRPPLPFDGFPEGEWLLERARLLGVEAVEPRPLVLGRHLMELGLAPGPQFKPILSACYEAQLDGEFATVEEGIAFARRWIRTQEHRSATQPADDPGSSRRD